MEEEQEQWRIMVSIGPEWVYSEPGNKKSVKVKFDALTHLIRRRAAIAELDENVLVVGKINYLYMEEVTDELK